VAWPSKTGILPREAAKARESYRDIKRFMKIIAVPGLLRWQRNFAPFSSGKCHLAVANFGKQPRSGHCRY